MCSAQDLQNLHRSLCQGFGRTIVVALLLIQQQMRSPLLDTATCALNPLLCGSNHSMGQILQSLGVPAGCRMARLLKQTSRALLRRQAASTQSMTSFATTWWSSGVVKGHSR